MKIAEINKKYYLPADSNIKLIEVLTRQSTVKLMEDLSKSFPYIASINSYGENEVLIPAIKIKIENNLGRYTSILQALLEKTNKKIMTIKYHTIINLCNVNEMNSMQTQLLVIMKDLIVDKPTFDEKSEGYKKFITFLDEVIDKKTGIKK
ncbi:MAG: hypothetical protein FWB77_02785 [Treponema sp.]|nr:hypothetical protein [Treponema sp.]